MPLQFCPISFTLFPSIKWGGKTYSILMHIRGISDTSSGGIDHSQSALTSYVPVTSIIRPRGCWLMQFRQVLLSSTSLTPKHFQPPLFITLPSFPPFLSCPSPLLHHLCPLLCPFSPTSPPTLIPVLFPPFLFPHISVLFFIHSPL